MLLDAILKRKVYLQQAIVGEDTTSTETPTLNLDTQAVASVLWEHIQKLQARLDRLDTREHQE